MRILYILYYYQVMKICDSIQILSLEISEVKNKGILKDSPLYGPVSHTAAKLLLLPVFPHKTHDGPMLLGKFEAFFLGQDLGRPRDGRP